MVIPMWITAENQRFIPVIKKVFHRYSESYPQDVNKLWITVENSFTNERISTEAADVNKWIRIKA